MTRPRADRLQAGLARSVPHGGLLGRMTADRSLAYGIPLAAVVGMSIGLSRPGPNLLALGAVALLPLAALAVGRVLRAATVAGALAYVAGLVWTYQSYISPVYSYEGLVDTRPELRAILLVTAMAVLPTFVLPLSATRPSTVVLWSLYVLGYVPAIVMPIFLQEDVETVLPLQLALAGSMTAVSLVGRVPSPRPPVPHLGMRAWTLAVTGLGLLSCAYIWATFGFRFTVPALADVYGTRATFTAEVGGAVGAGYVIFWAANVVNPLLLTLGLARARADLLVLGLLGQAVIYSVTGLKSVVFSIALVPLVYFAVARAGRLFGLLAAAAAPVTLVAASLVYTLGPLLPLALASRVFATPGQVGGYYFEFFSEHPRYHLSHSFLGGLFPQVYADEPPLLIGAVYFPDPAPNANANLWADAFANFGFGGILAFTIVLGLVLWVADGLATGRDLSVIGPVLAIAGLTLANGGLFTGILSGGLALGLGLMALSPPARTTGRAP
jgi:hypothetical protein